MKRLILMRHAKTEPWHDSVDDHGRALVERGHADAARIAVELKSRDWLPSHGLVSTARRARETWRAMLPTLGPATLDYLDDLYLAAPVTLEECLSQCAASGTVIVVAHNPGLHDLACAIAREAGAPDDEARARVFESFPTGSAALFEASADVAYRADAFALVGFIRPRDLS